MGDVGRGASCIVYSTLDPARAIETCTAGLETAKKIGDLGFQSRLYANLAVAYCALTNRCDERGVDAFKREISVAEHEVVVEAQDLKALCRKPGIPLRIVFPLARAPS